jgi:hypothetical protein
MPLKSAISEDAVRPLEQLAAVLAPRQPHLSEGDLLGCYQQFQPIAKDTRLSYNRVQRVMQETQTLVIGRCIGTRRFGRHKALLARTSRLSANDANVLGRGPSWKENWAKLVA